MLDTNKNAKLLDQYKNNLFPIVDEIEDSSFLETEKRLEDQNLRQTEFLILSVIFDTIYYLFKIILLKTENSTSTVLYLTIGLFVSYIIFCLICLFLYLKRHIKLNFNGLIFLSYTYIYLDILIVSLIHYFSKGITANTPNNSFAINVYDFNLILSGCLLILSCEFKFILRNRFSIGVYFISIIGLIIFRAFIAKTFLVLLYSMCMIFFLSFISFNLKKRKNILKRKCAIESIDTRNVFEHFNSITRVLNVGIYIFSNEELFFANEIGRNILDNFPMMPLNQISLDVNPVMDQIRPSNDQVKAKFSVADSNTYINQSDVELIFPHSNPKDESPLCRKKNYKLLLEKIILFEDFSKISEKINKFNTCKLFSNSEGKLENNNAVENTLDNKDKKLNLYLIFTYLIQEDSDGLLIIKDYLELGIFEFQIAGGKKTYYKIIAKVNTHSSGSERRVIEFIFKDVTLHYDLLNKIEENELDLKKNVHEFKTPILSMLGCAEELKAQLSRMEHALKKKEKIEINNSLDHMTNLSSFIGYQIKGLISKKEINSSSNSTEEHKEIKLNSLLNFCLNIMKTLLGCDTQKLKNIKAELKNDLNDYDVSFISDEIQVKQIILNFISNSVKFTNHGKVAIEAKLKKVNQQDALKIIIKDTGCGLKKEDNSKLFNAYAKFNNTQNNKFGTGLGLNICKSMAENLNMKIHFKSQENLGTKVTLCILNPIINKNQMLNQSDKIWKINEKPGYSRDDFPTKSASEGVKFNTQTVILEETKINFKCNTLKIQKNQTTIINEARLQLLTLSKEEKRAQSFQAYRRHSSKIGNSSFLSNFELNNSNLSDTFDIDANNMMPTKRLGKDHTYDIKQAPRIISPKILRLNNKKSPTAELKPTLNHYLCRNSSFKKTQRPSSTNVQIMQNESALLNLNDMKSINESRPSSQRVKVPESKRSSESEKILIVDDQLHARRALVFLLRKFCKENTFNYEIIEECDGIDCLRTIIKNPFNIRYVFIDENMSFMNGTEAAHIIRKLSDSGKITKINLILTSADHNMNYQNLFDYCVEKPVGRENLSEIVK